jgi:CO/xanthine dehydrogenase Mo-binding subunit
MEKSWIGESLGRVGGLDRVTGRQQYAADIRLDGVLQVKLVSLNCARARIISVDTAAALRIEGVRCILTTADLPQPIPRFGPSSVDRPLLADGETRFYGEPVAAVVADTEDAADAAVALIRVEYEELPPVLTVAAALDPHGPLVQDPAVRPGDSRAHSNIFAEHHFGWGDVEGIRPYCVVENDYSFPMVTHFAIEPHVFMAAPDADGVTVWSPIQHPYVLQRVVAASLGWPISRVRIIAPDPGGGFGGKGWPKLEPLMAVLALKTGRPVRLVLTLEETFQQVRRASAEVHIRTGFDADGRIAFQDMEANFLIGAYADVGPRVVSKASYVACGPYRVPHARIVSRALLSHTTPSTAFRGFGTPQASWAVESQLDEGARRLGIDRLEIRRRNLPSRGQEFIPDDTPSDGDWPEAMEQAASSISWGSPLAPNRGRGISIGIKSSATASVSFAIVRLHSDGSASVLSGTSDMGQGARTIFTQLVAEALQIPPGRITVIMGDTSVVPFDSSTSASRSTVFMGNAIQKACTHIKEQLATIAAEVFAVDAREISADGGRIRLPGQDLSYADVLKKYYGSSRGEVIGIGSSRSAFVPDHPLGGHPAFWEMLCAAVEVEVDPGTGMVDILKLVLVSDVGKALNPLQVETQDEGSAVMGIGHTLMEHLILDEHGRILNLGALDYRIPTIKDIPLELHTVMIENGDGPGPFGSKGSGEGGLLSIAAAIGSAVSQATGVVIRDLPLTPERIWRAIQEKNSSGSEFDEQSFVAAGSGETGRRF